MRAAPFLPVLFSLLLVAPLMAVAQTNTTDLAPLTTNAAPSSVTTPAIAPAPVDIPPSPPQAGTQTGPGPANGAQQDDIDDIRPPFFFLHTWFWINPPSRPGRRRHPRPDRASLALL